MAAILGREFEFKTLRRATDMAEEGLIGALEAAEHAQLIAEARRNGDVVFSFAHALIPASLVESVSVLRRRLLHRRAAAAIEAAHPEAWEVLAYHWIEAGEDELARLCSLRAADRAYASLARGEAVRHYRAALERWPASDDAGRADLQAKLGDCLLVTASGGTRDAYGEARDLYRRLGLTVRVGEMERRLGRLYYEAGDRERSMQHYQEALQILQAAPPSGELAMAFSSMSQMLMLACEYEQAVHWGQRAVDLAGELDVEDVRIHALNNVGCSLTGLGRTDEGLAMLRESCDRAIAAGLVHDAARAKMNIGDILYNLGRLEEARTAYEDLVTFAIPYQVVGFEAAARDRLVHMHWLLGEWDVSLRLEKDLRESGLPLNGLTGLWHAATMGMVYNDLGQPARSLALLQDRREAALRNDELQTLIPFLTQVLRAHTLMGEPEAARSDAESMLQHMDAASYLDGSCGPALLELLRWLAAEKDASRVEAAQACLHRLEALAAQILPVDAPAMLAEASGMVASLRADPAGAATAFASAEAAWADLGRPFPQARTLVQLGRALQQLGEDERAAVAMRQALALLENLANRLEDAEMRQAFSVSDPFGGLRNTTPID
jgi:tetratricopeptide (TPR) repeat protein